MLYVITGGCFFVQNKTKEDGECLNLLSCYKRYTNNCYVFAAKQEITTYITTNSQTQQFVLISR